MSLYGKEYYLKRKDYFKEVNKQYRLQHAPFVRSLQKQYYEKNKEALTLFHKQYRALNKEAIKEKQKQYRLKNKTTIHLNQAIYRSQHKEDIRMANKLYREKAKEKIKKMQQLYRMKNKEVIKERLRRYRIENKEAIKRHQQKYLQRLKASKSTPFRSWSHPNSVKEFLEYASVQLYVSQPADWYRISRPQVASLGGAYLYYLFGNLGKALQFAFPGVDWDLSKFSFRGKKSRQRWLRMMLQQLLPEDTIVLEDYLHPLLSWGTEG
eukprot:TRINITY_DN14839_c0_g1_i2.p1 TRINITY_DN14839_c0_g1~~TRINITY_DN14839_c0_g1_i2.p1  ORF type:complete len:266 (+),score=56.04 TRINITY_DN14839_c0_g1_i2:19-816(+)